jgi:hypothetical protein
VHRRSLLTVRVKQDEPELAMVHRWLDSWRGLDDVASGQITLRRIDGWRKIADVFSQRAVAA